MLDAFKSMLLTWGAKDKSEVKIILRSVMLHARSSGVPKKVKEQTAPENPYGRR